MKSRWQSKTWWVSLVTASTGLVALFVPQVGAFMQENAEAVTVGIGLVFAVLREMTSKAIK